MHDDMKKCMNMYDSCGGKYDDKGVWPWRFDEVRKAANKADPPSVYAACSTFFSDEMRETVLQSEKRVIWEHDLGQCCSQ